MADSELPKFSQVLYEASYNRFLIPALWLSGILITAVLIIVARHSRWNVFFPIVLSLSWVIIALFLVVHIIGYALPHMLITKP